MLPRPRPRHLLAAPALAGLAAPAAQARGPAPETDQTGAPYFVVKGANQSGVDAMPLKETRADIDVAGSIARVRVTQVYQNEGDAVLEATYVFPGSTRAAVFGMQMTVGDRPLVAEIQPREEARRLYDQAREAGQTASLLEQQRPNVFQMDVANIPPGDTVTVELLYTELLVPTKGVYELVYPAVVGPRCVGEAAQPEAWTAQGYTSEGVAPSYAWGVSANLRAGMPIAEVTSGSHPITVDLARDKSHATIGLLGDESAAGTTDFVLRYRLSGADIGTGLLLYEHGLHSAARDRLLSSQDLGLYL